MIRKSQQYQQVIAREEEKQKQRKEKGYMSESSSEIDKVNSFFQEDNGGPVELGSYYNV